jgi:hypothetical protein
MIGQHEQRHDEMNGEILRFILAHYHKSVDVTQTWSSTSR